MDLQDLFFSLTEGWLKRHLWLGTGQGVFTTWHVFNSHMRWHRAAYCTGGEFTIYTHKHARTDGWFCYFVWCVYVLVNLVISWVACVYVCVCVSLWMPLCGYATLMWHHLPVLTSDLIPLCLSDLKCHPINYSFLTSSCTRSLLPLKYLLPLSLTRTL